MCLHTNPLPSVCWRAWQFTYMAGYSRRLILIYCINIWERSRRFYLAIYLYTIIVQIYIWHVYCVFTHLAMVPDPIHDVFVPLCVIEKHTVFGVSIHLDCPGLSRYSSFMCDFEIIQWLAYPLLWIWPIHRVITFMCAMKNLQSSAYLLIKSVGPWPDPSRGNSPVYAMLEPPELKTFYPYKQTNKRTQLLTNIHKKQILLTEYILAL